MQMRQLINKASSLSHIAVGTREVATLASHHASTLVSLNLQVCACHFWHSNLSGRQHPDQRASCTQIAHSQAFAPINLLLLSLSTQGCATASAVSYPPKRHTHKHLLNQSTSLCLFIHTGLCCSCLCCQLPSQRPKRRGRGARAAGVSDWFSLSRLPHFSQSGTEWGRVGTERW